MTIPEQPTTETEALSPDVLFAKILHDMAVECARHATNFAPATINYHHWDSRTEACKMGVSAIAQLQQAESALAALREALTTIRNKPHSVAVIRQIADAALSASPEAQRGIPTLGAPGGWSGASPDPTTAKETP